MVENIKLNGGSLIDLENGRSGSSGQLQVITALKNVDAAIHAYRYGYISKAEFGKNLEQNGLQFILSFDETKLITQFGDSITAMENSKPLCMETTLDPSLKKDPIVIETSEGLLVFVGNTTCLLYTSRCV